MKKSTALLIIIISCLITYVFSLNIIDIIISKISMFFFSGIYFIVKQLEENKNI